MTPRITSACRVGLVLALGLSLTGCGKDEPPQPPPELRLEVGTGRRFTALADGDTLLLQRGCQNSQHVFVSLRAWGLPSSPVLVDLSLARVEDRQSVSLPFRVRYLFPQVEDPDAPEELPALTLVVPTPDPTLGKAVRLTAAVVTDANDRATDSRTGTLEWGPDACP